MTFAEMRTALKRFGFDDSDPIDTWLKFGMNETVDYYPWPWLLQYASCEVDEFGSVEMPEDPSYPVDRVLFLADHTDVNNRVKLQEWELSRFEEEIPNPYAEGEPEIYTVSLRTGVGTNIRVYPVPTTTRDLRLYYYAILPELSAADDTPGDGAVPVEFHYPMVIRAAAAGLEAENEEDRAITKLDQWSSLLDKKIAKYNRNTRDKPRQVTDVMGYR